MSDVAVRYPTLAAAFAAKFGVSLRGGLASVAETGPSTHFITAIRAAHWGDAVPSPRAPELRLVH